MPHSPEFSRRQFLSLVGATASLAALAPGLTFAQQQPDYETVGGHFFGQTGGQSGLGFGVSDSDDVKMWSTFKALGSAGRLGFPISRRFQWQGRPTQVFQRAVLQYDPLQKAVVPLNIMDVLHSAGGDPWLLAARAVPPQLPADFDAGRSWEQVVEHRQALLGGRAELRRTYFSVRDPITLYGLPTSSIVDMGNHEAIRLQRAVLQLWKENVAWANAGQVTAALIGQIAIDAGLFTRGLAEGATHEAIFTPEDAWKPAPPPPPPPPPPPAPRVPGIARPAGIPAGVRWIDVNISRQWLTAMQGDVAINSFGVTTGKPGFATPTGLWSITWRVYNETMDSATVGIPRDSPEGYYLKNIRYTQYFAPGGTAIHTNYWQPASVFGSYATSHGCVGMREAHAAYLWTFAGVGTPVYVHY